MENSADTQRVSSGDYAFQVAGIPLFTLMLLSLICVGLAMYTHGILKVATISLLMSIPFSVGVIGYSIFSFKGSKRNWYGWRGIGNIALSMLFSFMFFLVLYSIGLCVKELLSILWSDITRTWQYSLAVGFITLIVGGVLFIIRLKWKATYGLTEVMVGILIASHRAYSQNGSLDGASAEFYLAILAGGIYLVVRGLDNIYQGRVLEKDPAILLVTWIKAKILITDAKKIKQVYGN